MRILKSSDVLKKSFSENLIVLDPDFRRVKKVDWWKVIEHIGTADVHFLIYHVGRMV